MFSLTSEETITALNKHFPSIRIHISSIFPRKEEQLMNGISELNDVISKYCDVTHSLTFTENNQIDSKHLNRKGLFLFLSNIRYHVELLFTILSIYIFHLAVTPIASILCILVFQNLCHCCKFCS